ncbi:hypothetical protein PVK06_047923 [Gossypium arboreum]|uniref:Uncharacterized protein n=1 Tax=Gossypium arboreum TaxID=29729 RepID=A0ABR0MEU7_GOSAR|nr:hypothetical protein PVK06_047923 [Gossypium arboreum]
MSNVEIKEALFDMAPLKAPDSDGFHALFFQKQWDTIGGVICEWVRKVFDGNSIDLDLNNTLIVLILKVQNPHAFGQIWPISLCSALYKLTMKLCGMVFYYLNSDLLEESGKDVLFPHISFCFVWSGLGI